MIAPQKDGITATFIGPRGKARFKCALTPPNARCGSSPCIGTIVNTLQRSPQWHKMAIIITYDENGGFWDPVPPPKGDRWGPGSRVPMVIVSPFAKKRFVDHIVYDTTSILAFISKRFRLELPPGIRTLFGDLRNAFEFDAK